MWMSRKVILKMRRFPAFAISASLFANPAFAFDPDCTLRADSPSLTAEQIAENARYANGEICSLSGDDASPEEQSQLLDDIRKETLARMEKLKFPLTDQMLNDGPKQVAQMRSFMALTTAEVNLPSDTATLQSMTLPTDKVIDLTLPVNLHNPVGLPDPAPFTQAEMSAARQGLKVNLEILRANTRVRSIEETANQVAAGNNPEVPVAAMIGDMKRAEEEKIQAMGQVGFSEVVSQNPYLLFVTKANPSRADLQAAHAAYVKSINEQQKTLRELSLKPPDKAALSLIFFGPSVAAVLKKSRNNCWPFNALKAKAERELQVRNLTNLGLGLAAGATCVVAGALSFGALGAACFALSAGELATGVMAASDAGAEANVLYGNILQGGDIEQYQERRSDALAFSVGAGLSALGTLGSAAQFVKAARGASQVSDGAVGLVESADDVRVPFTKQSFDRHMGILERLGFRRADPLAPVEIATDADEGQDIPLILSRMNAEARNHPGMATLLRLQSKYGAEFTYDGHLYGRGEETMTMYVGGRPKPLIRIGRSFFDNPDKAASMLAQFEAQLARTDEVNGILKAQGFQGNYEAFGSTYKKGTIDHLELVPEADSTNEASQWMRRRMNRYGIKYYIDDSQFTGDMATADAFAQNGRVYLRSSFLNKSVEEQKELIAHESTHARLALAGGNAAQPRTIGFIKNGWRGIGPAGYTKYFRGDELEAWALSVRYGRSSGASRVPQFKQLQLQYLASAKAKIESGGTEFVHQLILAQGKSGSVSVPVRAGIGKSVDVRIPFPQGTVFQSEADAQAFFLDIIDRRIRQVSNFQP
jgi:hypothetical protein